ncbi:hypothetical protein NLJ89_g10891 [Agrocybe chaxingu]|uniref:Uncharacterized protein n=1 Tax=Agrocybe chaxingu TaxID=84603 RepID=A0A9W8JQA0_9AGAR|nr:hypothetical protein NLJ89_g10891 [Agrocybe chaxingu]
MDTSKPSPEFPLPMTPQGKSSYFFHIQTVKHLRYTGDIIPKVRNIHLASKDVKEVIKKLELISDYMIREDDDNAVIFQFLETLPNLQVLEYRQYRPLVRPEDLSRLRSASLLELVIDAGNYTVVEGPPAAGVTGLEKLSISWFVNDNPNKLGSSLAHLYELIRPSLTTLVKLRIDNEPEKFGGDIDLQFLKPAGRTLRTFEYTLQSSDESVLDTIPEIFPHLTTLSIRWDNLFTEHSDVHIQALAKNNNLTDLTLSSDFEESADDTLMSEGDYACWVQMGTDTVNSSMLHPFVIEERMSGGEGTRVVRGVKQDWMGSNQEDCFTKDIVKSNPTSRPPTRRSHVREDLRELIGLNNKTFGFVGEECLWCEGQIGMYKDEEPFPPLHEYITYIAVMDDDGNMTRPHNKRAAELLRRPVTHGPVLVAKMVMMRKPETYGETVVRYEELTETELRSKAFSKKRREWEVALRRNGAMLLDWMRSTTKDVEIIHASQCEVREKEKKRVY